VTGRERLAVLRLTRELAGSNESALRSLLPYVDEARVRAGDTLALEGRPCHELVIVASGELAITRRGEALVLRPGDSYGWEAMRGRGYNDGTVVAKSDAHLMVMSHAQFRAAAALLIAPRKPDRLARSASLHGENLVS
jgi:CRP-like cAMP-binding protein